MARLGSRIPLQITVKAGDLIKASIPDGLLDVYRSAVNKVKENLTVIYTIGGNREGFKQMVTILRVAKSLLGITVSDVTESDDATSVTIGYTGEHAGTIAYAVGYLLTMARCVTDNWQSKVNASANPNAAIAVISGSHVCGRSCAKAFIATDGYNARLGKPIAPVKDDSERDNLIDAVASASRIIKSFGTSVNTAKVEPEVKPKSPKAKGKPAESSAPSNLPDYVADAVAGK